MEEKSFRIVLLTIILVSCNHMNLFFIWHGFYTPLGAPWRYVFLWSFALVTAAYEGTVNFIEEEKRKYDYAAMVGIGLYFFGCFGVLKFTGILRPLIWLLYVVKCQGCFYGNMESVGKKLRHYHFA